MMLVAFAFRSGEGNVETLFNVSCKWRLRAREYIPLLWSEQQGRGMRSHIYQANLSAIAAVRDASKTAKWRRDRVMAAGEGLRGRKAAGEEQDSEPYHQIGAG